MANGLKWKFDDNLTYQTDAVNAVCGVFAGQPRQETERNDEDFGMPVFANAPLVLSEKSLLENLQQCQAQSKNGLAQSKQLWKDQAQIKRLWKDQVESWPVNLDVEMETGTGKTYVYTKTAFELHKRYGWGKFVIVVPTVAIREGVKASIEATAGHFFGKYGEKARVAVYDSKQPGNLSTFANTPGLNFLIINTQAYNTKNEACRRIYEPQDDACSNAPMDLLKACRPILILDEPQKMEKQVKSLDTFKPLFVLRYSATHKTQHDLVYRLDALDAYNQKLVKKIEVTGLRVRNLPGQSGYLYLMGVEPQATGGPKARLEFERRTQSGTTRRMTKLVGRTENLAELSGGMAEYAQGYVLQELCVDNEGGWVRFDNGLTLYAGDVVGNEEAQALREIQVRETIKAHLQKEATNFPKHIKTLSLFFIDHVADYRVYGQEDDRGPLAKTFERIYQEEVDSILDNLAYSEDYKKYLRGIRAEETHAGYFSQDKKSKHAIDRTEKEVEKSGGEDYDLILRDKESLLSLKNTERARVRFIFSHSALREGWDNPNVFVICLFKHTDNAVSRRQEVGRGLRLCVTQDGARWATGDTHDVNRLTVVTDEACTDFVKNLQQEFAEAIKSRSWAIKDDFLKGRELTTPTGLTMQIDGKQSKKVYNWLFNNDYLDKEEALNETFRKDRAAGTLAEGFPRELEPVREAVLDILDTLAAGRTIKIANGRARKQMAVNQENLHKPGFQELWQKLRRKTVCKVSIDTPKLIDSCIRMLNSTETGPKVVKPEVIIERLTQKEKLTSTAVRTGNSFENGETSQPKAIRVNGKVAYDLVGELADPKRTGLTRRTIVAILRGMEPAVRALYAVNPEVFIAEVARIINEEKTRQVLETIAYRMTDERYGDDFFTEEAPSLPTERCSEEERLRLHLYPWLASDSKVEQTFAKTADCAEEVEAFVKLPSGYHIPLPNGETYNPDWAVAFKKGSVRHVCILAETKGSSSDWDLRGNELLRKTCAEAWVRALAPDDSVRYHLVANYEELQNCVNQD